MACVSIIWGFGYVSSEAPDAQLRAASTWRLRTPVERMSGGIGLVNRRHHIHGSDGAQSVLGTSWILTCQVSFRMMFPDASQCVERVFLCCEPACTPLLQRFTSDNASRSATVVSDVCPAPARGFCVRLAWSRKSRRSAVNSATRSSRLCPPPWRENGEARSDLPQLLTFTFRTPA